MKIKVKCQNPDCGKEFYTYPSKLKDGRGKYCSRHCLGVMNGRRQVENGQVWVKGDNVGENNPNYRGGEWRECVICGKKFWNYPSRDQKTCSVECGHKLQGLSISGENNPRFRGVPAYDRNSCRWGLTDQEARNLKEYIKNRDGWACVLCGGTDKLQIHHINPRTKDMVDNSPVNLVTLCASCHTRIENPVTGYDENIRKKLRQYTESIENLP